MFDAEIFRMTLLKHRIKQIEVAKLLHLSEQTIANWIAGRSEPKSWVAVQSYLEAKLGIQFDDDMPVEQAKITR